MKRLMMSCTFGRHIRSTARCYTLKMPKVPAPSSQKSERFLSLDVECVASGPLSTDRVICSVAVVNYDCVKLLDTLVRPSVPVYDYLTYVTGFTEGCLEHGESEDIVLQKVYSLLGDDVVLVGQSPENDIEWLQLKQGIHFKRVIDISEISQGITWDGRPFKYTLQHQVRTLLETKPGHKPPPLPEVEAPHTALNDAKNAMLLYKLYTASSPQWLEGAKYLLKTAKKVRKAHVKKSVSIFDAKVVLREAEAQQSLLLPRQQRQHQQRME